MSYRFGDMTEEELMLLFVSLQLCFKELIVQYSLALVITSEHEQMLNRIVSLQKEIADHIKQLKNQIDI